VTNKAVEALHEALQQFQFPLKEGKS